MSFTEIVIIVCQFFLSLSLLIVLHEAGHFIPAKLFKTRVEKFYLFFDVKFSLFKKKIGETVYGIGWLPLGGYVKISGMIDESMDKEQLKEEPKPWEFRSKPAWQRLIIMLGGVIVNFVLAWIILVGMSYVWGDKYIHASELKDGITVSEFAEKEIGLKDGDKILTIDGEEVDNVMEISKDLVFGNTVTIERNGEKMKLDIPVDITGKSVDADVKMLVSIPLPVVITKVPDTSQNADKNIKLNSIIKTINGVNVTTNNFKDVVKASTNKTIKVTVYDVEGNEEDLELLVNKEGKIGVVINAIGKIDDLGKIGFYNLSIKEYTFIESFGAGTNKFIGKFKDMMKNLKALVNSHETGAAKGLGSFISIAKIFPTTWDWQAFWNITAFLSIMLGVLNLLPIPALDGGHAMFLTYEIIFGRKPSDKFLEYAQMVGFFLLIALFVFAFGNDIYRHFIK